jgi:hypothetical protein
MSSPSQSINVLENLQALERQNAQYVDSNGNPVATLHDTSITVESWQSASVFNQSNSQVFPTSFFDDSAPGPRENQPIVIGSDTESILEHRASLQLPLQTTVGSGLTTENVTNPSGNAPELTSYKFDYVTFCDTTQTSTDTTQMCQQMRDHQEIHNGLILNEIYRHIQEHFEPIAQRSIQLQQELLDIMIKLQDIQTEQRHLTEQVVDLSESIDQQARRAIEQVPMDPLRARYPAFFIEEPRPTPGPSRPQPPCAVPISQTARLGSP